MISMHTAITLLQKQKVLPLFYHTNAEVCKGVVEALYHGGIRLIEFTNRGSDALSRFTELSSLCKQSYPEMRLAVGTIASGKDAEDFIEAGADVLISPFWDDEVAVVAKNAGVLWIPGCMTPTEIHHAVQEGIQLIKLFPGNVLGTGFVEAIRPLFPGIHFVVTGGVDATAVSVDRWLKSGVVAAGLGSKLITGEVLEQKQFRALQEKLSSLLSELGA
ncbi:MAG: bifunctional 4-hydroxy-2-oxoglutarate aldolase/2-dehydro-3-deoxy-phosphogluconate aldolase [Chitinophagaceae bacterium]